MYGLNDALSDIQRQLIGSERWQEIRKAIRAQFPKRDRRLNPVLCPITGEETSHWSGLSSRALELVRLGLVYESQLHSTDRKPYIVNRDWCRNYAVYPPRKTPLSRYEVGRDEEFALVKFIAELTNQEPSSASPYGPNHDLLDSPRLEEEPSSSREGLVILFLTDLEVKVFRQMGKILKWWLIQERQNSYREGSFLIGRIAEGSLTIDQINEELDKRDGR